MAKKAPKKDRYINVCPKCGSTDVHVDFSNPVVWAYGTRTMYKCGSCGHLGNIFPETMESRASDYKKEVKEEVEEGIIHRSKEEKIDAETGAFAMEIWLIVLLGVLGMIVLMISITKRSIIGIIGGIVLISLFILTYRLLKKEKKKS